MKRSRNSVIPHRRKREGKTDYRVRLELLKSRKPRLVVRKSQNNIICQIVQYEQKGDKIIVSAVSRELKEFGWKFHPANLPSAYLAGFLCAERAKKHKVNHAILDIGLYSITPGNRLFSALKGAIDGGLEIPHSAEVFPSQERLSGRHIAAYAEKLRAENPAKYKKLFSLCIKEKAEPKDMPALFEETKKKIAEAKGERKHAAHAEHAHHAHAKSSA